MVDTTDLKSVDLTSRVGSSPTTPNLNILLYLIKFLENNKNPLILVIILYKSIIKNIKIF